MGVIILTLFGIAITLAFLEGNLEEASKSELIGFLWNLGACSWIA